MRWVVSPLLPLAMVSILLSFQIVSSSANAAEFEVRFEPGTRCIVHLTGEIEEGDFDTFLETLYAPASIDDGLFLQPSERMFSATSGAPGAFVRQRICLDSPGGSFDEAMKIANHIVRRFGTVIEADGRCLSACAFIFSAGSQLGEEGFVDIDRHMHATATLGYHPPSLPSVPTDNVRALNTAYGTALSDVAELIRLQERLNIRTSLLIATLRTDPDEFTYVDTVGKATRWQIAVFGVPWPQAIDEDHVWQACNAALVVYSDDLSRFERPLMLDRLEIERHPLSGEAARLTQSNALVSGIVPGYGDEAVDTCEFLLDGRSMPSLGEFQATALAGSESYGSVAIAPHQIYPAATKLDTLAADDERELARLPAASLPKQRSGICRVITHGAIVDEEPCRVLYEPDPEGVIYLLHIWPSGAQTTLLFSADGVEINGSPGSPIGFFKYPDIGDCVRNQATENSFCFQPN